VNESPRLRPAAVIRIALACAKADLQLRTRAFSRLVDRIKERRNRRRPTQPCDQSSISSLVHAFNAFRSFYPRPYLCLFDSLALLEFLSSYRIYPQLVIGVVPDPFEAHCWLQEGTVVLNDDLERIRKYTSIAGF
jgi:Transglutaminase-like superfamily